jgi:hypothetical protein
VVTEVNNKNIKSVGLRSAERGRQKCNSADKPLRNGRAVAQAVSRWPGLAYGQHGGGQSGTGAGFLRVLRFSSIAEILYILDMTNCRNPCMGDRSVTRK